MFKTHEAIGLVGVGLILIAYLLLQTTRIKLTDLSYSMLNLLGAFMVLISLIFDWNLPSFVIEIFWLAISAYGIYKYVKHKD